MCFHRAINFPHHPPRRAPSLFAGAILSIGALAAILWIAAGPARALSAPCAGSDGASCPYASVTIIGQRAEGVLRFPEAVALDGQGDLYVADQLSYVVEKFTLEGAFQTQWGSYGAGPGQFGPIGGIATDALGNVYVVDSEHNRIEKFTSDGTFIGSWGHSGSGLGQFHFFSSKNPSQPPGGGIAVTGNYVYVVDSGNNRIERFNLEGGEPMQWGTQGSGPGQFDYPRSVAANAEEVIVSDDDNHRIEKFDPNGNLLAIAGSAGTGTGQFGYPYGVSIDGSGNVYVADDINHRIVKLNPELKFTGTWGGHGSKPGQLAFPRALASDPGGETYVADTANDRIEVFDTSGNYLRTIGLSGWGSDAMTAPQGLASDPAGTLLVSDTVGNRIQLFGSSPTAAEQPSGAAVPLGSFQIAGPHERHFSEPTGIGVDPQGSIYIAEPNQQRISRLWGEGSFLSELGGPAPVAGATLDSPNGIAVASGSGSSSGSGSGSGSGDVYVADTDHNRILVYPPEGTPLLPPGGVLARWGAGAGDGAAGSGPGEFDHPDALAVNRHHEIYVADTANNRIVRLSPGGFPLGEWGGLGTAPGSFNSPSGIAIDGAGNVYVVDSNNNRLQEFDAYGHFLAEWGTRGIGPGEFSQPTAVAIDCLGNIYVADTNNNRVERFDPVNPAPAPGGCESASAWPPPLDVPPVLHLSLTHRAHILAQRSLALSVSCQRACRVRITGTLAPRAHPRHTVKLIAVTRALPPTVTRHFILRVPARLIARLRQALGHKRGLTARLEIQAVGPTGRRIILTEHYLLTR